MKRSYLLICFLLTASITALAQTFTSKPKLVVGVVVDQMRWDYLSRYYDQMPYGGLKRLINDGYSMNNCLINYVPTITAIGHSSIYTGTTPAYHGICGNSFYVDGEPVGCVADENYQTVGSDTKKGQSSPHLLLASTIGDQLRLHTDFRSKVIGVSYKDRAAILPAGRSANAAYWMDNTAGCFVTSTYYMNELPAYAKDINAQMAKNKEVKALGKDISLSPVCGHLITDMAIAAIKGENLGRNGTTDMLCVSYSQTDAIGHKWATRGQHTDEAYMGLDQDIKRLLSVLDAQVGHENYLLFLTADHGGIPGYRARIRPIVSRITIHWPSFYNVVTGKTLALPNLIALQHIPLSPAGVIAKRPAPIALPNSCAAEWRMAPDAVFSPYASVRYFTPHMVHSQYNLL